MRKYIFTALIALLALPVFAQQRTEAKVVLDKTAAAFEKAGGIKASFNLLAFNKGRSLGQSGGSIQLKGEKFLLKTSDVTTWFDGRTQWSSLTGSGEVNISTPTQSELQSINPYALLYLYQKGFSYKMGTTKILNGKPVYEVVLTSSNKKQELSRIVLYVAKDNYQPLRIVVETRKQDRSEITVTGYQTGLKYATDFFTFDRKQYPHAEIIDLR